MTLVRRLGSDLFVGSERVPVRFLGKGMFSHAYREAHGSRRVFVLTHPEAIEKDVLAEVHAEMPDNPHLPAVKKVGEMADGRRAYVMPHYRQPAEWRGVADDTWEHYGAILRATWGDFENWPEGYREPIAEVIARYEQLAVPPRLKEALLALAKGAAKHGDRLGMEIDMHNVAFDGSYRLVLLDLLYVPTLGKRLAMKKLGISED
jgi:hypothetical protein